MTSDSISNLLGLTRPNFINKPPSPPPLPPTVRNTQKIPKPPTLPSNFETVGAQISACDDGFKISAEKAMFQTLSAFQPTFFFFYGSLMDPEVLQHILCLDDLPPVETASIKNFKIKMWGIYPALVPEPGATVTGNIWPIAEVGQFIKLARYETSAYTPCDVEIMRLDGEIIKGKSFRWAGDPNSKDLEEGIFDLNRYQTYFKPALIRKSD